MKFNTLVIATSMITSCSLSAQPSVDLVLLTAPSITETVDQNSLLFAWTAPADPDDLVWFLPPSGSKVLTSSRVLAREIVMDNQTGTYSLYFPASGLRMDLIVE